MLQAESKISERTVKSKEHEYQQYYIYLPKALTTDSAFPFNPNDKIILKIEGDNLIITKKTD